MPRVIDKLTPSYDLEKFKASDFDITVTAQRSALALGINRREIDDVVATMTPEHFYKSMTSYANNKIWQDVYHVPYQDMLLYIKFTEDVVAEFKLLSFKEK
ncbi:MAG: type II toxin-antitoxin system MqsR family toxin [Selenomonadaceae bacterium]|nr:type II toxin-antitoxin system MqsR family toxin [Selenomonadaceae bacterium]